jgi:hypothetical protein
MDQQTPTYNNEKLFNHRKNEVLIHAETWIDLENIMLREIS